jgi:hypothetical protein
MDYPVPLIKIRDDNTLDLSQAYDDKIGSWDIRTVLYAYQDFPDGVDAASEREQILKETIAAGFKYVADNDSRSAATAHPDGNLWDNGADAIVELQHLLKVREIALQNFSARNVRIGRPLAKIEEVLVPIYLLHRFQIEAVAKLIGGEYFAYNLRGDGQSLPVAVTSARQQQAIDALIATLDPAMLSLSDELIATITPRPPNNSKSRETFSGKTGIIFDPKSPAAASVAMTLRVLLEPSRAARLAQSGDPDLTAVTDALLDASWYRKTAGGREATIERQTNSTLERWLSRQSTKSPLWRAHYDFARFEIQRLKSNPAELLSVVPVVIPPGSPIGSYQHSIH